MLIQVSWNTIVLPQFDHRWCNHTVGANPDELPEIVIWINKVIFFMFFTIIH